MTYLAAFAAALIPVAGGIAVNAWLRPSERRWPVLVGGGAALGLGLMVFAQMALLRVLPIQAAVIVTYVLFGLIGAGGAYSPAAAPAGMGRRRRMDAGGALGSGVDLGSGREPTWRQASGTVRRTKTWSCAWP